jgi:hypothetical protein
MSRTKAELLNKQQTTITTQNNNTHPKVNGQPRPPIAVDFGDLQLL